MALAIQNDLFQSRLNQALTSAQRVTAAAQVTLDASAQTDDPVQVQNLMISVLRTLSQQSSADAFASYRIDTDASSLAPQNVDSLDFDRTLVTPELRELVRSNAESQWWQSVELRMDENRSDEHTSELPSLMRISY